jgi:hypothetical protein
MRRVGDGFLAMTGVVGGLLIPALTFALFVGGVSYRKDCLTDEGRVSSDWTFTVFAPIPYVFRPSQAGCEIHTGTRVALNALGIASFDPPTEAGLVEVGARGNEDLAYWGKLKLILRDYMGERVGSLNEAAALIDSTIIRLEELSPTDRFADGHAQLLEALRQLQALTPRMVQAISQGRPREAQKLAAPVEANIRAAIEDLGRTQAQLTSK